MNSLGVQVSITNVFTKKKKTKQIVDLYPRFDYV